MDLCQPARMPELDGVRLVFSGTRAELSALQDDLLARGVLLKDYRQEADFAQYVRHAQERRLGLPDTEEGRRAKYAQDLREEQGEVHASAGLFDPEAIVQWTALAVSAGVVGNASSALVHASVSRATEAIRDALGRRRRIAVAEEGSDGTYVSSTLSIAISPAPRRWFWQRTPPEPDSRTSIAAPAAPTRTISVSVPVAYRHPRGIHPQAASILRTQLIHEIERRGWRLGMRVIPPRQTHVNPEEGVTFAVQGTVVGAGLTTEEARRMVLWKTKFAVSAFNEMTRRESAVTADQFEVFVGITFDCQAEW